MTTERKPNFTGNFRLFIESRRDEVSNYTPEMVMEAKKIVGPNSYPHELNMVLRSLTEDKK